MAIELKRRRFTVKEYHRMAQAGILGEDDRVELIEGEIVEMTPIGHRHIMCVNQINRLFVRSFDDVAMVSVQNPVRLDRRSEPQPDLALLRLDPGLKRATQVTAPHVFLLVEVAETSVETDRRVKVPLYARAGIPEVWLVDLGQENVTAYLEPTPSGYRTARVFRRGEGLAPSAFPGRAIAVADILPE